MKLTTAGATNLRFKSPVVGRVSWESVDSEDRGEAILLSRETPDSQTDLAGYRGFMTEAKSGSHPLSVPSICSVQDLGHLRTGDIVAMEPASGFVRTLYRPDSDDNEVFVTERCNSNCLMCSQPPRDRDDTDALLRRNLEMICLIKDVPSRLVITGGEPTLLGRRLFTIISTLRDKLPSTYIHMLTNGRIFAWPSYTSSLAELKHPNFMLGIPLYSNDAATHDYIVQARGAHDQTVLGLQQLARYGLRIEIRVVLHGLTIFSLPELAEYIFRNFPFAEHVALMGLENIGYAPPVIWTSHGSIHLTIRIN